MTYINVKANQYQTITRSSNIDTMIKCIRNGLVRDDIAVIRTLDKATQKKEIDALKNQLPQIFCCNFSDHEAGSSIENVVDHNGIMVFDFDYLKPGQQKEIKEFLAKSPIAKSIVCSFESPTRGLKVFIQTDYYKFTCIEKLDENFYSHCYKKIVKLLIKIGAPEEHLDKQTCNMNRGTYMSHDPDLWVGEGKALQIPLKWWEEYEVELKRIIADRAAAEARIKGKEWDEEKANRHVEKMYQHHMSRMCAGNRHTEIWLMCCRSFEAGWTEYMVTGLLERLRWEGHWTESMSPAAKAKDAYRSWKRGGGQVSEKFTKMSPEQRRKATMAGLRD